MFFWVYTNNIIIDYTFVHDIVYQLHYNIIVRLKCGLKSRLSIACTHIHILLNWPAVINSSLCVLREEVRGRKVV